MLEPTIRDVQSDGKVIVVDADNEALLDFYLCNGSKTTGIEDDFPLYMKVSTSPTRTYRVDAANQGTASSGWLTNDQARGSARPARACRIARPFMGTTQSNRGDATPVVRHWGLRPYRPGRVRIMLAVSGGVSGRSVAQRPAAPAGLPRRR